MADSILRLKVESSEYDNKLKQATQGLTRYVDECRKAGGTLEVVEKDTLDYVRAIGQMETHSRTVTGKINEMRQAFVEFSSVYKNMTDQEKASPVGKALSDSLDQLKGRISDSKAQLAEINAEIGETGKTSDKTDMSLKGLAEAFGLNITKLTTIGGALGLAQSAFNVFTDAMMSSRETADNFGRDIQGLESIYNSFLLSLNNGDISGFLGRIQEIVSAARGAYDALSELQEFNAFNRINVQKARTGLNNAITDYRGGTATKEQVQQANEILKNELKERSAREQAVYEETINQVAKEYKTSAEDLKNLLAGNYTDWANQKHSNLQGSGNTWSFMPFGTATGAWNGASPVFSRNVAKTSDERLSVLARTIPLERLDKLQQLGEQAEATNTEIAQLDKSLSRLLNKKETGSNIPKGGGGKTITEEKDEFTEIIGLVGNAQERVSDLQRQISESWDEGEIARLTGELKVAQTELQRLKDIGKEKPMQQGLSGFNQQTMSAWMQGRQGDLAKAEYGSADYSSIMGNIADMNTIKTILEQSMKAGINAAQFDLSGLWEKVFDGDDIPDATWQAMVNKINEKLKEMKLEPISIEFKTGEIAKDGKIIKSSYKDAASAVNSLGSALSGLDDPGAKIAGTIAQAIANIALAFSSADLKEGESGNIWYWIAATAAGMATMISTISAIHSATGYQKGGVVKGYQRGGVVKGYAGGKPVMGYAGGGSIGSAISGGMITGSTYSNDQIPVMANAGEVVLTNAMTTTLASKLNDQGNTGYVPSHISGEQIYIALNRFMRRSGRGEIVTWKS